ncbi:hypothetical protein SUGI_0198990 [Cryptomeria japonica]|nr:hypothetical protein SUGI_0198990 [Cryptomeria japonica]
MDSSAASWHVFFVVVFIFFSTKSMGTQSGVDEGSLALGSFATRSGGRFVGHSSNELAFENGDSVREMRKVRGRGPLVPPTPKSNGNVSYKCPRLAPPPPS